MNEAVRRFLAEIGRRGGARSKRTLTPAQAKHMVAKREALRCVREFDRTVVALGLTDAPGFDLVHRGLHDLVADVLSVEALLVSIAAPRLRLLGIRLPQSLSNPEEQLFAHLTAERGDGAHSQYNALIRRLVSFAGFLSTAQRSYARAS